jgi:putative radical SAM enzyme (TIGR03279 family)
MPAGNIIPLVPAPIHPDRPPEPHAIIEKVDPGSLGEELGLRPRDEIVSINGSRMEDVIDYRFLIADEEVEVAIAPGGDRERLRVVTLEKEADETLGVTFVADVFDGIRICANDCDFCFVYQNAKRMRRSVYIKDDDYRLSFLHGDFITLTNLSDENFRRIIDLNLSPLYVSIHATDPEVRVQMLRSPRGAQLWEDLGRLIDNGIQVHGQVVLCPGMNDGAILERTVKELAPLYPRVLSLAIVPVGLTKFRSQLPMLRCVNAAEAAAAVDQCAGWQRRFRREIGSRFVFPSDEFYLIAGRPLPASGSYEGFAQFENGVGMISRMQSDWRRIERRLPARLTEPRAVTLVTGTLAAPVLEPLAERLSAIENLTVRVQPIRNDFFGRSVTVAGLITGTDILTQCREAALGDLLLVPTVALRDDVFLDDMTLADLARELQIAACAVPPSAQALAEAVTGKALGVRR